MSMSAVQHFHRHVCAEASPWHPNVCPGWKRILQGKRNDDGDGYGCSQWFTCWYCWIGRVGTKQWFHTVSEVSQCLWKGRWWFPGEIIWDESELLKMGLAHLLFVFLCVLKNESKDAMAVDGSKATRASRRHRAQHRFRCNNVWLDFKGAFSIPSPTSSLSPSTFSFPFFTVHIPCPYPFSIVSNWVVFELWRRSVSQWHGLCRLQGLYECKALSVL